jgi:myo-inositol-1(or 4)-monophosphatase
MLLKFIKDLAKEAGELSVIMRQEIGDAMEKTDHRDLVTKADIAVEHLIMKRIEEAYPEHSIISEESGIFLKKNQLEEGRYAFVIDPIDGTTSYVSGTGYYGISIALLRNGAPYMGVVYNPVSGEMFSACMSGPSGCLEFDLHPKNPAARNPSQKKDLKEIVFSTALFWDDPVEKVTIHPAITSLAKQTRGIRMNGCAALDLCMVACGRLDAYIMPLLQPWDYAAGATILLAAGGMVSDIKGTELDFTKPSSLIASAPNIHTQLISHFNKVD